MVCWPQMPLYAACVASFSNRVIARKLEREQNDKKVEGGEGGEKRKRLPANLTILENAPDILRFGSFVNWQLVKIQWNLY